MERGQETKRVLPVGEYVSCPKLMTRKMGWKIGLEVCKTCEHLSEIHDEPAKAVVCVYPGTKRRDEDREPKDPTG